MNDTALIVAALALAITLAVAVEVIRLAYRLRESRPHPIATPARERATLRDSIHTLVRTFARGATIFTVIFGLLLGLGIYRGEITAVQALDKAEHYTVTLGDLFIDFAATVRNGNSGDSEKSSPATTTA